jgi:phosphoglycolate phosphatase
LYDLVLFDLDGTLTDSKQGIIGAVQYAMDKMGLPPADETKILSYIGGPFREELRQAHGFDKSRADRFVELYREYYLSRGIHENRVFDGIENLLAELHASGKTLAVATAKPRQQAETVLTNFNLRQYFGLVAGAKPNGDRSAKVDVIRHALSQLLPPDLAKVVMVGDRCHDILGARENGIDSVAVTYGYATDDELRESRPTYFASSADKLRGPLLPS